MRYRAKQRPVADFLTNEDGGAVLEFVIWLPALTLWLLFSVSTFIAWDSRSNAAKTAYAVSDLISRLTSVDSAALSQVMAVNNRLTQGPDGGNRFRVSSITYVSEDEGYQVQWSCATSGDNAMSDKFIPLEIMPTMAPFESVILTEFYVPFTPITTWAGLDPLDWSHVIISRPRVGADIPLDDNCPDGWSEYTPP